MDVRVDPERTEPRILLEFVDFVGKKVLEIGSGDGRLTWRYADRPRKVVAIEPFEESYRKAVDQFPSDLRDKVEFHNADFLDFAAQSDDYTYDIILLSGSLC